MINQWVCEQRRKSFVYINEKLRTLYYKYGILPENRNFFQDEIKEIEKNINNYLKELILILIFA